MFYWLLNEAVWVDDDNDDKNSAETIGEYNSFHYFNMILNGFLFHYGIY